MTLLEWKKKEEIDPYSSVPIHGIFFSSIQEILNYMGRPIHGIFFSSIQESLNHIAMDKNLKKNSWSLSMIKKVFYGTAKPGRFAYCIEIIDRPFG